MHDLRTREAEKRLEKLKKSSREREGRPPDADGDWHDETEGTEHYGRAKTKRKKRRSKQSPSTGEATGARSGHRGTIVTVRKKRCKVAVNDDLVTAWLSAETAADQKQRIAVGDEVELEKRDRDWIVHTVLPRRTTLSRPDPFSPEKERVVAANVDVVVQVSAAKEPPLKTGLIDRYLIAIERGGARPVICVNKIDQADEAEREELAGVLAEYHEIGIPILFSSASTGEGLDRLREEVSGRTAVLVGHSGVGKSSLLTALDEQLQLAARELHSGGRSGRHTTTSSTLYEFPDGTRLIDTPGIREFGLFRLDKDELRFYFEEFEEYSLSCRFRNCSHLHEPDCAVQAAAREGKIPRYERYVRIAEELP